MYFLQTFPLYGAQYPEGFSCKWLEDESDTDDDEDAIKEERKEVAETLVDGNGEEGTKNGDEDDEEGEGNVPSFNTDNFDTTAGDWVKDRNVDDFPGCGIPSNVSECKEA